MVEINFETECERRSAHSSPQCSSDTTQEHVVSVESLSDGGQTEQAGSPASEDLLLDDGDDLSDAENVDMLPEETEQESFWVRQMRKPKFWAIVAGVVVFLLLGVLAGTHIFEAIISSKQWFLDNRWISVPWYCTLFSVASAVLMPYGPFCISIGYIFGIGWGFAVQSLAIFVSSAFIYVIGRVCLKQRVDAWLCQYRLWRAIMECMGRDHLEAAKINILMCFIPMPYGTHAYLFSISRCAFWNFVCVFELGMVGHTFLNLAVGDALALASDSEESQTLRLVGTVVGALAMVFSIWYGGVVTQRVMDECYTEEKVMDKLALLDNAAPPSTPAMVSAEAQRPDAVRENEDPGSGVGLGERQVRPAREEAELV